ncbi:SDR family NAD(P)-dependent oxidoreductase OS=Streptomyces alboniger OX=132473 GN=CP975_27355 PE=4 SV=1 [Streptomyces alboniger]
MEIEVLAVPLDDKEATAAAVADVRHRLGPIGAVVHSAGAVDTDNPAFVRKPWSGVERVVGPKVFGLDTLVECFRDEPLSLFVVYSSVAASVPSLAVGQSDYAMANAYLEHGRRGATAFRWSAWRGRAGRTPAWARRAAPRTSRPVSRRSRTSRLDRALASGARVVVPAVVRPDAD